MKRWIDPYEHLKYIVEEIGPRPPASPAERALAEYAAGQMKQFGLQVKIEPYNQPRWIHEGTMLKLAGDGESFPALAFLHTPGGHVSGKLESIGVLGLEGGMRQPSVRGKVLLAVGNPPGNVGGVWAMELERRGAKALIYASLEHEIDTKRIREPRLKKMPTLSVSGLTMRKLLSHIGKEVVVDVKARTIPGKGCNTVAVRPGRTKRRALFIAHSDTAPHTVGALDNGVGCALLLSLAERLGKSYPDWNFEFLFAGGDEYPGFPDPPDHHLCMAAYIKRHPVKDLDYYLEIDCVGSVFAPDYLHTVIPPQATARLQKQLRGRDVYLADYSDKGLSGLGRSISERGIPGMFLLGDYGLFVHIHTPSDNLDVVSRERLNGSLEIMEETIRGLDGLPRGLGGSTA